MKKFFLITSATLFSAILFFSCKKDNAVPPPSVVGFWKGKLGIGGQYPVKGYAFLFRNNGTVRVFYLANNPDTFFAAKAEGTYLVTGNKVNTTHTYLINGSQHSSTGTLNGNFTFTEGTWGHNLNPYNGGKFFLNKQ